MYMYVSLSRDALVTTNRRASDVHPVSFVRLSVWLSGTGMQRDHMVHFSADLSLRLDIHVVQCSGQLDTKTCPPTASCLFPVPPGRELGCGCPN